MSTCQDLQDVARRAGEQAVKLAKMGLKPRDMVTMKSFENAIMVHAAISGSTNSLLHIPAAAKEFGLEVDAETFDRLHRGAHYLLDIRPAGRWPAQYFYYAGGVPRIMEEIKSMLHLDVMTVTGKTLAQNLAGDIHIDRSVIRTQDDPASVANGIQVLYGNLAPEGALVKTSAVPADQHVWSGPAMVFNSEEEAIAAYNANAIKPGTGVVVRYEGPKGGPGMKELHRVTEIM